MTLAYDPTYASPNIGWTVQLSHASSGTTGPVNAGVVAGELGYVNTTTANITINGVTQAQVGGASGPISATAADPSLSGAVSIDWEKRYSLGNVSPAQGTVQGLYKPLQPVKKLVKAKTKNG